MGEAEKVRCFRCPEAEMSCLRVPAPTILTPTIQLAETKESWQRQVTEQTTTKTVDPQNYYHTHISRPSRTVPQE